MSTSGAVLSQFFRRSSYSSERTVAWIRLVLVVLAALNIILAAIDRGGLLSMGIKYPLMLTVLSLAGAWSAVTLLWMRQGDPPTSILEVSATIDAILATTIIGASVVWPSSDYRGLLSIPHAFGFLMAVLVSGLRLSPRAVTLSAVLNGLGAAALVWIDLELNPIAREIPPDDHRVFWIFFFIGSSLAWATVRRSRALVQEGGLAMVDAERARQRLGVYVSPEVAEAALTSDILEPGGERRHIAVLFSDLRGFTRYAERLPPERLVSELNDYLDAMVAVVREEQGVVDKYIGDAIMVVWGIPKATGDEAARAVRAAAKMQAALAVHNRDRAARGLQPFRQGIGVHYGEAVAGNIGTSDRLQYTVVGDAVNLASRLEQATKEMGASVLISADAMEAASAGDLPMMVSRGRLQVRGREAPMEVFALAQSIVG
ncbi:MAG: adenylate/guanylate cyclase domain-containing protein [Alphaproteobacteria bacterium]|nr:adenylate/guanylate cyclase domain-containing protein [Alphaproteobacteria bacterium]